MAAADVDRADAGQPGRRLRRRHPGRLARPVHVRGRAAQGYRVDFITLHWYGGDFTTAQRRQPAQVLPPGGLRPVSQADLAHRVRVDQLLRRQQVSVPRPAGGLRHGVDQDARRAVVLSSATPGSRCPPTTARPAAASTGPAPRSPPSGRRSNRPGDQSVFRWKARSSASCFAARKRACHSSDSSGIRATTCSSNDVAARRGQRRPRPRSAAVAVLVDLPAGARRSRRSRPRRSAVAVAYPHQSTTPASRRAIRKAKARIGPGYLTGTAAPAPGAYVVMPGGNDLIMSIWAQVVQAL